jgi:hypothetical protein
MFLLKPFEFLDCFSLSAAQSAHVFVAAVLHGGPVELPIKDGLSPIVS